MIGSDEHHYAQLRADLEAAGHFVVGAANEVQALEVLAQGAVGAVISETALASLAGAENRRVEAALRESEDRFAGAFHTSPAANTITRVSDGKFVDVNQAFLDMFEFSREEVVGHTSTELNMISAEERGILIQAQLDAGGLRDAELLARSKSGKNVHLLFSSRPMDVAGEMHHVTTLIDITARKQAEYALQASEEKLRRVFEHASQVFYSHDPTGTLTYVSPQILSMLDCTFDEAMVPWTEFLTDHPRNADGIERTRQAIETGLSQPPYHLELRSKRGRTVWVEVHESPVLEDGKTVAIVGALTDITDRVNSEVRRKDEEVRQLRQRDALVEFTSGLDDDEGPDEVIRRVVETAAKTLGVARASVWRYNPDRSGIRCVDLYDALADTHSSGAELLAATYPSYFRALQDLNVIAADDACCDPRTREFSDGYLRPLGIASMLDAPIHISGVGEGVFCNEHIGEPRTWAPDEQAFAFAVANRISLALEAHRRRQSEKELATSVRFAQNTIDALSANLCVLDEFGNIVATNRAWREFAESNPPSMGLQHVDGNYLDVCDHASGEEAGQARAFAAGIRAVLAGSRDSFELEYSCHSPDVPRWFVGRVTRFTGEGAAFAVVAHENITSAKLAQSAQLESAEQLRLLVEAANVGLWDWDLLTNTVTFSKEWKSQLGYDENEISNDFGEWESRVHPDDLEPALQRVRQSLAGPGQAHEVEFRMRHKDGSWRWIYTRAEVTFESTGKPIRMQGCHVDITRRMEAEAETVLLAQRLSLATGAASIGVWDWDVAADRWFANDTYFTMLGYSPEEGFGDRSVWLDRVHPKDRARVTDKIQKVLAGSADRYEYEARLRHADGTYRWVRVVGSMLETNPEGAPTRLIGVRIDITDSRRTQEALEESELRLGRLNAELEKRIAERTVALVSATDEATRANRAKSEFLSRMSHELRTPMNAILGYAQLLEMETSDTRQANYVAHILKGGRHLLDLINEVLELSRIEADRVDLSIEAVRVSDIVHECRLLVLPIAEGAGVTIDDLTMDSELYIRADQQRLRQVLMNLLANAIKYNLRGGAVQTSVHCEGDTVRIDVADTGVGVPPELRDRLFQPFERLGATESEIEGTGLGLSLSLRMANAMGGNLSYRPGESGSGSVFSVTLARGEAPTIVHEATATVLESRIIAAGTVLYIEDNPSNVQIVRDVLARFPDVRLLVAMQGRMGIDLAEEHRPDLILLDLHLPDMEGAHVLAELKAIHSLQGIPVIVLSADATNRQIKRLLDQGAHAYMTKPFELPELFARLNEVFSQGEGRDGAK